MRSFVVLLVLVAGGAVGPADLLGAVVPTGFELAAEPPVDLTFDQYEVLSLDAVAHVDPGSTTARSMRAAVDVWTAGDDILVREMTLWGAESDALAFLGQAVVIGTTTDRIPASSPFDGAVAFFGAENKIWTRTATWSQGPYAVTIAHFSTEEGTDATVNAAATALRNAIGDATGHAVATGIEATSEPVAATTSPGGITLGAVLLWMVVAGLVAVLVVRFRLRRAATRPAGGQP